jgi:hypothetical protein
MLESIQELRGSFRALAAQDDLMEAPAQVELALLKTFRDSRKATAVELAATQIVRVRRFRLALAAAAALIVIAIASIIYTRSNNRAPNLAGRKPEASAPAYSDAPKNGLEELPNPEGRAPGRVGKSTQLDGGTTQPDKRGNDRENQLASYRGPTRNRPVKRGGAKSPERTDGYEIATEYFPINLGSYLQPFDGGRVLRIKLPRSALMNYGLPVDPLRADEEVKADVVIGNDGMARAIRFVH